MESGSGSVVVETQHEDVVHDTQWDYYGRYLATCSSDRTIRIFTVGASASEKPQLEAILNGHEGPVWMVAWAHPRFGSVLASCSYDHRAIVWKGHNGLWKPVHIIAHKGSVNAVQFSPNEYGLLVATASSDGAVTVTAFERDQWREPTPVTTGVAHPMGAMAVSFAPIHHLRKEAPLLASGGGDSTVKVWSLTNGGSWRQVAEFSDHKDWVRDVAFSPDNSSRYLTLASCSQDKHVIIRRIPNDAAALSDPSRWEVSVTPFTESCWRLSWSPCGSMLLVTTADSHAYLLKQGASFTDEWIRVPVEGQ